MVVAVAILSGCAAHQGSMPMLSSLPQQDRQAVGSAVYPLEDGGKVEIYHQGYGVRSVQGVAVPTLRIQVSVENQGGAPLTFRAADTKLVDNRGDTLAFSDLRLDGQPTSSQVEIPAGGHAQLDLFYDLPASYAMDRVDNFRVFWSYARGEASVSEETMFVKADPKGMFFEDGRGKKKGFRYFMAVKA